jgi:hypothetical protein
MIINEIINIKIQYNNIQHFINKGYICKLGDILSVNTTDLTVGSHEKIHACCDDCLKNKVVFNHSYHKIFKKYNKYLCKNCVQKEKEKTNIKKYGVKNVMSSKEIQDKRKEYFLEKYDVTHPCKNENIKNKIKQTNINKYGVEYLTQNETILNKIQKTNIDKYGNICSLQNEKVMNKTFNTMLDKYGNKYSMQNDIIKNKILSSSLSTNVNKTLNKYKDIIKIVYTNGVFEANCDTGKNHTYIISTHNYYQRILYKTIKCTICNPIDNLSSGLELDFIMFIESLNINFIHKDRTSIKPQELDVYIPSHKLAFEFNGLYWHSDIYKDNNYHLNKTEKCLSKNIRLIHIYEDDWLYKKDIIKSKILNIFDMNDKINIIDCTIKEIHDIKIIKEFINNNDLKKYKKSNINYSLLYKNNIILIMSLNIEDNLCTINNITSSYYLNTDDCVYFLLNNIINKYNISNFVYMCDRDWCYSDLISSIDFKVNQIWKPTFSYIKDRYEYKNNNKDYKKLKIFNSGHIEYILNL